VAKPKQYPIKITVYLSELQKQQLEQRATEYQGPVSPTVAELIRYAVEQYLQRDTK
jgi:hypothetical protein